jgi:hypothetical protein
LPDYYDNNAINNIAFNNEYNRFRIPKLEATDDYYSFDLNELHIVSINSEIFKMLILNEKKAQFKQWLFEDLSKTFKPWKIVMMHHSLYCFGTEANICGPDTELIRDELEDIFLTSKVNLVISGDKMIYERSYPIRKGQILEQEITKVKKNQPSTNPFDTSESDDESGSEEYEIVIPLVNEGVIRPNNKEDHQYRYDDPIGPVYLICGASGGSGLDVGTENEWNKRADKVDGLFGYVQGRNFGICEINANTKRIVVNFIYSHTEEVGDSITLKPFKIK